MREVGHEACVGEMKNACKTLARKLEGKRPLGRPGHRWKDNMKKLSELG
jgi:hypothetical protein